MTGADSATAGMAMLILLSLGGAALGVRKIRR